jgi:hypothetical protein
MFFPQGAMASLKALRSGTSGAGAMRVTADQYGTFGLASFRAAEDTRTLRWQFFGALNLSDGTQYVWLTDPNTLTSGLGGPLGNPLLDSWVQLLSDTAETAKRTSHFEVSKGSINLAVDLVQEIPEAGYNFVQNYTFTNLRTEPTLFTIILFNDQDLGVSGLDDRVGFVSGPMPRMYFIDEQDVAGPGHPSVDDRAGRISVITQPGAGLHFDGYLGGNYVEGGGFELVRLFGSSNFGIAGLNGIHQCFSTAPFDRCDIPGIDADQDADGLVDFPGDVSGALQFSVDLPANGSTSLGINYVGGSLQNAVFLVAPELQAGDADMDLDFDQLDLVRVQIAGKYLSGQAATWGEGDWNAAPGGSPGNPPPGDGLFNQLDIVGALTAGKYLSGPYAAVAPEGSRGDGQTSIIYDPATGALAVGAPAGTELTSINVDSTAGIFTGQAAQNLGGSFDNDSDGNIFKATFGSSFGSLSFGNVAQAGLSEQLVRSDLTVVGSLAGGGGLGNVDLIYVPEPTAAMLILLAVLSLLPLYRACT